MKEIRLPVCRITAFQQVGWETGWGNFAKSERQEWALEVWAGVNASLKAGLQGKDEGQSGRRSHLRWDLEGSF